MKLKFNGSLKELERLIGSQGIHGHFLYEGEYYVYVSAKGGSLNWWPQSGTMTFSGTPSEIKMLHGKMRKVLETTKLDPRLESVIVSWPDLPLRAKKEIHRLIESEMLARDEQFLHPA